MIDFATSDSPAVQRALDKLAALSLPKDKFGLETIRTLLGRLGNPQEKIPPVFHVAGTNGKGSTCAFLRAMLEAQGYKVHAATKPHLVRYNERIRLAGRLIDDDFLASLLEEVLASSQDLNPSFFEATTAAIFLAFSRVPADVCIIEVGLGGRFDATNVLTHPAACAIAILGIDHEGFLLRPEQGVPANPLERIAFEKAMIAKSGAPLVTQSYPANVARVITRVAAKQGAELFMRGRAWRAQATAGQIHYQDGKGMLILPLPNLAGAHQVDNAALAVAILRHQDAISVSNAAMAQGITNATWPARLQLLGPGPLTNMTPAHKIWLDGGHNPNAGEAIARHFAQTPRVHLITGMLTSKHPDAFITPFGNHIATLQVVPVPGHESHPASAFGPAAKAAPDIASALASLPPDNYPVLIAGSLYLAGHVLKANDQIPD